MNLRGLLTSALCALTFCAVASPAAAQGDEKPAAAAEAVAPSKHGELTAEQREIFYGAPEDPPAKELLGVNEDYAGRSYLAGDEWNLHLYREHIEDIGGTYVGVGADQGYLLMSWSQPEYGFLIDYDPLVVETHKIYRAFFLHAKTPKEFMALWKRKNRDEALEIIEAQWEGDKNLKMVKRIYRDWRRRINRRLVRLERQLRDDEIPSYLTDQKRYDFIRGMIATDRIRPMSGNLLEDEGLIGIGEAARKLGAPVRVLYLSNAQEYWAYPKQYRENIAKMYFDEKSYVLHTLSTWTTNKDYRYVIQPGLKYQEWMTRGWVRKVYHMVPRRKLEGPEDIDFIYFDRDVDDVEARRKKRRAKKKKKAKKSE